MQLKQQTQTVLNSKPTKHASHDVMERFKNNFTTFAASLLLGVAGMTNAFAASPAPVDLLSAGNFVILSQSGVTDVPGSLIGGNVGASPITGAAILVTCPEVV